MKDATCIYISGPIKDNDDFEKDFADAQVWLEAQGYEVKNPCDAPDGLSYEEYMRFDLLMMLTWCNRIYMLKGWEKSTGARCEHLAAIMAGFTVMYE